jgi:GxxExxY protein
MAIQNLKYRDMTEKIIGCAMKVHRYFGPGFPEIVYKRALIIELERAGLTLRQEVERDIIYETKLILQKKT